MPAEYKIKLLQIHHQILHPKRCALAERGRLGGLEMGVGKSGQCAVFLCKCRKRFNGMQQKKADAQKRLPLQNDIGVIADIAAGCAQMNDRLRQGAGIAVGVNVRHHIMADGCFIGGCLCIVDIIDMRTHLFDLRIGDRQSELLLAFRQGDPQAPPGGKLAVVGENLLHLPACVSSTQGVFVGIMHDGNLFVFYLQTAKSRLPQIFIALRRACGQGLRR